MTSQLEREIREQPEVLRRLLEEGRASCAKAAEAIRGFAPEWMTIAARGTSDNAARYAQYLFGAMNGLGVGLAVPSLYTLYNTAPNLSRAAAVGISQSGQSPDVVAVLGEARRQGGLTVGLTNDLASPLAMASDVCIPLMAAERAVAATKTYTAELLALAMLSVELSGDAQGLEQMERIPDAVATAIDASGGIREAARAFADDGRFVVLGRGFNYCTVFEIALKMKETSYVMAEPYSVADFLHGPVAMIDSELPVILVSISGSAGGSVADLMGILERRRTRVIALTDDERLLGRAEGGALLPAGLPEWLSPIVTAVPGQIWALSLAEAKGLDPDSPRGLTKVTLTK